MATSSFTKDFTLNTKKGVESFETIISTPTQSVKIKKEIVSPDRERRGELKLRRILSSLKC